MPLLTVSLPGDPARAAADNADDPAAASSSIVIFRDPRFMIDLPLLRSRSNPPLTGTVELDPQNRVLRQTMDGAVQR
jgi:inner membrane protein